MKSPAQVGRACSRVGCRSVATMTLTYIYAESTAVVGPLATYSEPHSYDLCEAHGKRLTVPNGWTVIKEESSQAGIGPSEDDLMAIADAVREVGARDSASTNEVSGVEVLSGKMIGKGYGSNVIRGSGMTP